MNPTAEQIFARVAIINRDLMAEAQSSDSFGTSEQPLTDVCELMWDALVVYVAELQLRVEELEKLAEGKVP